MKICHVQECALSNQKAIFAIGRECIATKDTIKTDKRFSYQSNVIPIFDSPVEIYNRLYLFAAVNKKSIAFLVEDYYTALRL